MLGSIKDVLSIVTLSSLCFLAFVTKFGTSTPVVDEPIADLVHADPSCLYGVNESIP
jgi:hypothetical protein